MASTSTHNMYIEKSEAKTDMNVTHKTTSFMNNEETNSEEENHMEEVD